MDIQRYQTTLDILHNGFIICTVLAILFLIITVLLFWRFDILTIIQQRFGIEAKRSREEFKEVNESTGALKYHSGALGERTPRTQLKPQDDPAMARAARVAAASGGLSPEQAAAISGPLPRAPEVMVSGSMPQANASRHEAVAPLTTQLNSAMPGVAMQGAVSSGALPPPSGAAIVAAAPQGSGAVMASLEDAKRESLRTAGFEITRNVLLIHTTRDTLVP
jgi:hypothetical protein